MSPLNVKLLSTFILKSQVWKVKIKVKGCSHCNQDTIWRKEEIATKSPSFKEARPNGIKTKLCEQES